MERSQLRQEAQKKVFRRKCAAEAEAQRRREEYFANHPECCQAQRELTDLAAAGLKAALAGDAQQVSSLRERQEAARAKYDELLRADGLTSDSFSPQYHCPLCQDSGRVDGKVCSCVLALEREMLVRELGGGTPLEDSDFSLFSLDYYPVETDTRGISPRRKMEQVLTRCRQYAASFDRKAGNLLFVGATGLGKTHLSLAIAKEVTARGYFVLYGSAQNFLENLEREHFGKKEGDTLRQLQQCDLLILDDLGAEFTSPFVVSAVYNVINTRILSGRATIVSTNLSLRELEGRYTERLLSRFVGCYEMLEFAGRDIRVLRRLTKA